MRFSRVLAAMAFLGLPAAAPAANDPETPSPVVAPSASRAARASAPNDLRRQTAERFSAEHPETAFYHTGSRITRIYGAAFGSGTSPVETAEAFRTNYAGLFGVAPDALEPVSLLTDGRHTRGLMIDRRTGEYKFTLVYYSQHKGGFPVFRSDLRLLVRNAPGYPLSMAAVNLRDLGGFSATVSQINADAGIQAAIEAFPGLVNFTEPEIVVWAGVGDMEVEPAMAVTFVGDNRDAPGATRPEAWRFVTHATTGEILHQENMVFLTDVAGNVQGNATQGLGAEHCELEAPTDLPYARVNIGSTVAFADVNGDFVIPNAGTSPVDVESRLWGQWFRVFNQAAPDTVLSETVTPPGPADFLHNAANSQYFRAEVNAYLHSNVIRDFVLTHSPAYPGMMVNAFPVYVNRNDGYCPCNAWYDSSDQSMNFCTSGSGCPNTAWLGVIYHEYGHYLVNRAGSGQGQYGEGSGDVMNILVTDDPGTGYGFFGPCSVALRMAVNTLQYPCTGGIHDCGRLLSGCVWSLRNELTATHPSNYMDILSDLAINAMLLHTGDLITPQITIDYLTLDDTDGDIYNGTPHAVEICGGFGYHGMDCPPISFDTLGFAYPDGRPLLLSQTQPTVFRVDVLSGVGTPIPGSALLHMRVDGGPWVTSPMTELSPNQYESTLPAAVCAIDWYLSAQSSNSGPALDPTGAPAQPHTARVGTPITVVDDDIETDQGWTVGDGDDTASKGIWDRADPEGTQAQPEDDRTPSPGTICWVTDSRAGSNQGTYDVDGGKTTLFTPVIDLSGIDEALISYYRWYSNDTGSAPNADVFVVDVSDDDGGTWTNVETVGPAGAEASGGWFYHEFQLSDFATPTSLVKLRFIASDEGSGSIVEAAVDDFLITGYLFDPFDLTPPTPNPTMWETLPAAVDTSAISMTAAEASDAESMPIEYYFFHDPGPGAGGNNSGWQLARQYTDNGLDTNTIYTYNARSRDSACPVPNAAIWSFAASGATHIETPTGLSFGSVTDTSIEVTADGPFTNLLENLSGLFFEMTPVEGAGANEWGQAETITVTGLTPGTLYTFRVKARNQHGVEIASPWVGPFTQSTSGGTPCPLAGDVNGDGALTAGDIAGFIRAKLGQPAEPGDNPACADYGSGTPEGDTTLFVADLLSA